MLIIGGMIDCDTQYNKSKFKYVLMQSKFELDAVLKSEFQKGVMGVALFFAICRWTKMSTL